MRWWGGDRGIPEPIDIFRVLKDARKLLILPNDRVGGTFIGAPVFKIVRQFYPQAQIHALVDERMLSIARQIPFADEVLTGRLDTPVWRGEFRALQRTLIEAKYDLVFCLGIDCSFRLVSLCQTCQACLRVGFRRPGMAPFNVEITPCEPVRYEGEQNAQMLRLLGMVGNGEVRWTLAKDKVEQVRARYLDNETVPNRIVAVDLGRGEGLGLSDRQLDDIIGRVIEHGARAVLFYGQDQRKRVGHFKQTYGNRAILFGQDDLANAAPLLQGCHALIACNSEMLHLGISLQIPSVGLFDEDPQRWVAADNRFIEVVQVQDLRSLSVGQVIVALDTLLRENPTGTSSRT